jgi:hypothetical protein
VKPLIIISILLALLNSCKKHTEPHRQELVGIPTGFVINTRYVSHTSTNLVLEMDIGVVASRDREIMSLNDSAFHGWGTSTLSCSFNKIEQLHTLPSNRFSTILAFDQSSNYDNYDPFNQRLRTVNKLLLDAEAMPQNELGLAFYNRSDVFTNNLQVITDDLGNPFHLSRESLLKHQFWMPFNEKGSANMYDAISTLIDTVSTSYLCFNQNYKTKSSKYFSD